MLYYDCVHLYLIKMVAIYMQIERDSASWQFVSGTLSITNHLCPYLSSPGALSEEKPNSALRGCKHNQTMCLYRYKLATSPQITESSLLIPKDVFLCSAAFHNLSFHIEAQW